MQHFEPKMPSSHAKSSHKKKCCGIKVNKKKERAKSDSLTFRTPLITKFQPLPYLFRFGFFSTCVGGYMLYIEASPFQVSVWTFSSDTLRSSFRE